ncbi:uncharacterized protein LOC128231811 isoform X1 [Mya arenaria]|uniref:uncharacterized protein LOC128231811 isoform X1 n=1 Tax=Mya arenaria TaxID=6604 RepID=UPI0022E732F6|nr:uncharacterized protein LOC128231811 isoform X1 [Mya arenaria]
MDAIAGRNAANANESAPDTTYCKPCSEDGKKFPPEAFCPVCNEFMCSSCARVHTNMTLTKNHTLQENSRMSPSFCAGSADEYFTGTCQLHGKEFLKYYCLHHEQFLCGDCLAVNEVHRSCKVEKISQLDKRYNDGAEYNSLKTGLGVMLSDSENYLSFIRATLKSVDEERSIHINELRTFRNEINQYLDKREKELLEEIDQKVRQSKTLLNELKTKVTNMKAATERLKSKLQAKEANSIQLLIVGKRAIKELAGLQTALEDVNRRRAVPRYIFQRDTAIEQLLASRTAIGRLEEEESNSTLGQQQRQQEAEQQKQKHTHALSQTALFQSSADLSQATFSSQPDIQVKTSADIRDCWLTSLVLFSKNRILLADRLNETVKLLDTKTNMVVQEVKLPGQPWDLCLLPGDMAAVTLPWLGMVQFVSTKRKCSLLDIVKVGVNCYGIDSCDDNLIVSFISPGKVVLMDMHGKMKKSVNIDSGGNMFQYPTYLTVTREGQTAAIYISDLVSSTITKLSIALKVVQTFKDPVLSYSQGISPVGNNQLLLCGKVSDNILLLDTSTGNMTQMLGKEEGIESPYSVAYCPQQKRVFVTCSPSNRPEMENFVKVFDLV